MTEKDRITQVNEKLNTLKKYHKILKQYEGTTVKEMIKDDTKRGAIERYFQLAAEVTLDIAGQLIAEYRFRTPETYKESILILGEEGVLSQKSAQEFCQIAGFRNILVHEYLKIDYEKVARNLNHNLGDFEKFAQAVAKYLSE